MGAIQLLKRIETNFKTIETIPVLSVPAGQNLIITAVKLVGKTGIQAVGDGYFILVRDSDNGTLSNGTSNSTETVLDSNVYNEIVKGGDSISVLIQVIDSGIDPTQYADILGYYVPDPSYVPTVVNKGYTTRQKIENYLLITIDSSFYDQVEEWISEIEAYIDKITGRNFVADSIATAKKYDGDGTSSLLIDDAVAITEVKIGTDVFVINDDYVIYPANELPKTKIKLIGSVFPCTPIQDISIKGKWGYSISVPKDIQTVATVLVAGMINYSLNADGEVASETIGRYTVSYKDEKQWQDFERIDNVLEMYKKYTF